MDVKELTAATTFYDGPPLPPTIGPALDQMHKNYVEALLKGGNEIEIPELGLRADANKLVGFYKFMFDRHDVWHRRFIRNMSRPWTIDPILKVWKFTNVWRELDRGTVYLLDALRDPSREGYRNCVGDLWSIMHYRLFNNWEAHKALGGFVPYDQWNYDDWYKRLRAHHAAGNTVLCMSHNTCCYTGLPGSDKIERVCLIAKRVHDTAQDTLDGINNARSLEQVFDVIRAVRGYGPFLAYEVVSDILYTGITPFSVNDWANAGPGAMNGIARIFHPMSEKQRGKKMPFLDIMQWLRTNQKTGFDAVKFLFGCDFESIAWQRRPLDLRCIEHQLCEYSKIVKLYQGNGRNFSGHVKPIDRGPDDFERMKALF